jgi:integrase
MPPNTPVNLSKLSAFLKPWQKDIIAGYNHSKPIKDADQYLKTVEMFIGLMGDLPVGRITFERAAEFRELILQMPATHGKGATGSPKKELARARADKTLPRVTMKTAKRHFSGMNSIWKWLTHNKHVPTSLQPFSGHSFPGTKSKKSARDDWSREDLQRLFTSREYRDAPDASALHWLPLISLHSGMRLEEICRLRPSTDIVVKDAMPCFDITPREGWDPKTEAGIRIIPIHSWLIRHGLMDFVKRQRATGAEHLFSPELTIVGESLSSGFSRIFSKLKIDLGVGEKTTFHSFRHTFRTVLESTDLKESHIDAVMGHEGGGSEGRTYTKRVSTAKLKEVVEAFEPPLDLAFLRTAAADAAPPSPKATVKKRKLTPPVLDEKGRIVRLQKT